MKDFIKSVDLYLISAYSGCRDRSLYLFVLILMLIYTSLNNFIGKNTIVVDLIFYTNISNMLFELIDSKNCISCKIFTTNQYSKKIKTSTILFVNSAIWLIFLIFCILLRLIVSVLLNNKLIFSDLIVLCPVFSVLSALRIILSPYLNKKFTPVFLLPLFLGMILMVLGDRISLPLVPLNSISFSKALICACLIFISGYLLETVLSVFLLNRYIKKQPDPQ